MTNKPGSKPTFQRAKTPTLLSTSMDVPVANITEKDQQVKPTQNAMGEEYSLTVFVASTIRMLGAGKIMYHA